MFKKLRKLKERLTETKMHENNDGNIVLTKIEDFMLYVICDSDDNIIGTVLLTVAQAQILNLSFEKRGVKFIKSGDYKSE